MIGRLIEVVIGIAILCFIFWLVFPKTVQDIKDHGIKPTVERLWNGPEQPTK